MKGYWEIHNAVPSTYYIDFSKRYPMSKRSKRMKLYARLEKAEKPKQNMKKSFVPQVFP